MIPSPVKVLLVEDEETDVILITRAMHRAGLSDQLITLRDGQQAVDYFGGEHPYDDRQRYPLPGLVLLDLKMPKMTGFEVLAWLQAHPPQQAMAVVVLSSSCNQEDMCRARAMGAADYCIKPNDVRELVARLQELLGRWLPTRTSDQPPRLPP